MSDETTVTVETAAHEQRTTLRIVESVPAHEPREGDPHYKIFNQIQIQQKIQN